MSLDPNKLRAMPLTQLSHLMRSLGLSTLGLDNEREALNRLLDRTALSPLD